MVLATSYAPYLSHLHCRNSPVVGFPAVVVKMLYDTTFDSDGAAAALIYGVKNGGIGLAKKYKQREASALSPQRFYFSRSHTEGHFLNGAARLPSRQ